MGDLFKGVQDIFISRLKNMFFINFVMAWVFINYKISFTILFSDMKLEDKLLYIDGIQFEKYSFFFFPLAVALGYIFLLPIVNLLINILYEKIVNKYIEEHKHKKLLNNYRLVKERQRAKLESSTFIEKQLDLEYKKKENDLEADAEKIKEIKEELKKLTTENNGLRESMHDLTNKNTDLENLLNRTTIKCDELINEVIEKNKKIDDIQQEIAIKELELKENKKQLTLNEIQTNNALYENEELQKSIKNKDEELEIIIKNHNEAVKKIELHPYTIEKYKKEIMELKDK